MFLQFSGPYSYYRKFHALKDIAKKGPYEENDFVVVPISVPLEVISYKRGFYHVKYQDQTFYVSRKQYSMVHEDNQEQFVMHSPQTTKEKNHK